MTTVANDAGEVRAARLTDRQALADLSGQVHAAEDAPVDDAHEVVRGAKGVEGGAVQLVGDHPA